MSISKSMMLMTSHIPADRITFFCIGTDRSTGDAFGPLVGTALQNLGYSVIGTIDEPAHAVNLVERMEEIPSGNTVIAVDASLGVESSVGIIQFNRGPVRPGAGVGKDLRPIGDYHLIGIVNVGGFMEYFILQNTRLSRVMQMVQQSIDIICAAIPLPSIAAEVAATTEEWI